MISEKDPSLALSQRPARGISVESLLLLTLALALGGWLRFAHLGADEIEGDEAVSWQAARAPTIAQVVQLHEDMNRGKLPVYSIVLHLWIKLFGQSEAGLRALSASLGTLAIALVWFAVYEAVRAPPLRTSEAGLDKIDASLMAALCALLAAASLILIRYSREARMYPLMLTMVLAQVGFLMRASRRGGLLNYGAAAAFTALAIAANFTASLTVAAEFVWLTWIFCRRASERNGAAILRLGATLAIGVALLAPYGRGVVLLNEGVRTGMLSWMSSARPLDPIRTFESSSGGWVFATLALLAAWGCVKAWRSHRELVVFALLWMWLPPLVLLVGSFFFFPMNADRYSLSSFIPFFMLASLPLALLKDLRARYSLAVALLILMVVRANNYYTKRRDAQFREAAEHALRDAPSGGRIGVANWAESFESTLYYMSLRQRNVIKMSATEPMLSADNQVSVVILPESMPADDLASYRVLFPHLDGHFRQVEVRSR